MHVTMSSSTTVNDITIPRVERPIGARSMKQHIFSVAQFVAIVVQFGLIVVALDFWQLESQLLARVMWLAFAGFIIHHLLPCDSGFRFLRCCHSWQSSRCKNA
jgi:hypothetical protein